MIIKSKQSYFFVVIFKRDTFILNNDFFSSRYSAEIWKISQSEET